MTTMRSWQARKDLLVEQVEVAKDARGLNAFIRVVVVKRL